jgi:hypothetical protein
MATRSLIGKLNSDNTVTYVYCHWDGYPEHTGAILKHHYTTSEKIDELLALGDLSVLGKEIGEKHNFIDRSNKSWCTFYGRDRNEYKFACTRSLEYFLEDENNTDYKYLFDLENNWKCYSYSEVSLENI